MISIPERFERFFSSWQQCTLHTEPPEQSTVEIDFELSAEVGYGCSSENRENRPQHSFLLGTASYCLTLHLLPDAHATQNYNVVGNGPRWKHRSLLLPFQGLRHMHGEIFSICLRSSLPSPSSSLPLYTFRKPRSWPTRPARSCGTTT